MTARKRDPKGLLAAAAAAGAAYDEAPFRSAAADARYELYLAYAIGAIEADDAAALAVAISELLSILRPHAAGMPDETLRKLLGVKLTYLAERHRGADPESALAQAMAFRPRRYRLSADSALDADLQGRVGAGSMRDLEEAREFLKILHPSRVGRPGPDWTREKWDRECAKARAEVRRLGLNPTQKALATSIGLPLGTFRDYIRRFEG